MAAEKFHWWGQGWRVYVDVFPEIPPVFAGAPNMPGFVAVGLHFDRDAPLCIQRVNADSPKEFYTIGCGNAQMYISVEQARAMRVVLDALFDDQPAESSWNRFPQQEFDQ